MKLHVDNYTKVMLTVIAVLLTVVAAGLWCESPNTVATAEARLPDSGLQFNEMIQGLAEVEQAIAELSDFLRTGTLRVEVKEPPKTPAAESHGTDRSLDQPARSGPQTDH